MAINKMFRMVYGVLAGMMLLLILRNLQGGSLYDPVVILGRRLTFWSVAFIFANLTFVAVGNYDKGAKMSLVWCAVLAGVQFVGIYNFDSYYYHYVVPLVIGDAVFLADLYNLGLPGGPLGHGPSSAPSNNPSDYWVYNCASCGYQTQMDKMPCPVCGLNIYNGPSVNHKYTSSRFPRFK